ncbi:AMP-binding protein, partial [Acinetobacter baumannii]
HNVLSQQAAVARVWPVGPDDVLLSYLPWHHCFGSLFERLLAFWNGAQLVLDDSRGRDLELLITNFREIKPTVYLSVPRVYQGLVAR